MTRTANYEPPAEGYTATATPEAEFRRVPIEFLHESPLNPRKHFNEAKLAELVVSIKKSGILTPLLARPHEFSDAQFELAAGHRRRRAAERAGLTELPVLVRPMTDAEFIEVLTVENLQREDVHPLEEAQGFADLMKHAGYDVARIADRVGRSHRYVYDRLRLLQLTDELQQIFVDNEITAAHAVILARLSADDQQRVLKETGALFTIDHGYDGAALDLDDRRKAMSVRELQRWVDEHVRFDPTAEDVPELFPETAAIVAPALEQAKKVIAITHLHFVQPEAKTDGERTYGPQSWKRVEDSKPCEHAIIGVIAAGPGRGEAFEVCTAKKTCTVHWGAEIRAAKQRANAAASSGSGASDGYAQQRAAEEQRRQAEEAKREAWRKALPGILSAVAVQVKKKAAGANGPLGTILLKRIKPYGVKAPKELGPGASAEDLVRHLTYLVLAEQAEYYHGHAEFPKIAKSLGVDVAKFLKGETATEKKPAAKKTAKRAKAAR